MGWEGVGFRLSRAAAHFSESRRQKRRGPPSSNTPASVEDQAEETAAGSAHLCTASRWQVRRRRCPFYRTYSNSNLDSGVRRTCQGMCGGRKQRSDGVMTRSRTCIMRIRGTLPGGALNVVAAFAPDASWCYWYHTSSYQQYNYKVDFVCVVVGSFRCRGLTRH